MVPGALSLLPHDKLEPALSGILNEVSVLLQKFKNEEQIRTANGLLKVASSLADASDEEQQGHISSFIEHVSLAEDMLPLLAVSKASKDDRGIMQSLETWSKSFSSLSSKLSAISASSRPRIDSQLDLADSLKAKVTELAQVACRSWLEKALSGLQQVGFGGESGQSWKASLPRPAVCTWKDLIAAGQKLMDEEYAGRLKKAFADANKASLGLLFPEPLNSPSKTKTACGAFFRSSLLRK